MTIKTEIFKKNIHKLEFVFNKPINDKKLPLNDLINNNDYLHKNNFHLEMYQQWEVSKPEMGKVTSKG